MEVEGEAAEGEAELGADQVEVEVVSLSSEVDMSNAAKDSSFYQVSTQPAREPFHGFSPRSHSS